METFMDFELNDCPVCRGMGRLEEEAGWCVCIACEDCGSMTAEIPFKNEEEKDQAIRISIDLWNLGKVVNTAPGT